MSARIIHSVRHRVRPLKRLPDGRIRDALRLAIVSGWRLETDGSLTRRGRRALTATEAVLADWRTR